MIPGEKLQVVVGVKVADFGEVLRGVVSVVDDVAEQNQVMGFWWGVVECEVEAAAAAVQVGDGHCRETVRGHGFNVGVQRALPCVIFVV